LRGGWLVCLACLASLFAFVFAELILNSQAVNQVVKSHGLAPWNLRIAATEPPPNPVNATWLARWIVTLAAFRSLEREPPPGKPVASLAYGDFAFVAESVTLHGARPWHQIAFAV